VRALKALIGALAVALASCSVFLVRPPPPVTRGNFPACTELPGAPAGDLAIAALAGLIAGVNARDSSGQIVVPAAVSATYLASGIYGFWAVYACRDAQADALESISPTPFRAPNIVLPRDAGPPDAPETPDRGRD
jgi:hypothetical protein